MVWYQIDNTNAHVTYLLIGLFCILYSLVSYRLQNYFFITESFFATLFGIVTGSNILKWINPYGWVADRNINNVTYELSRLILCIQIFTTAIDTPERFLKYHWKTIGMLIIPVMTYGWIVTGVFIKLIFPSLHFTDGLLIAGCITATDPCLSASIMTGQFALKNVPEHLRHIIAVESGVNDGMAFPFIYLSLQLIKYNNSSKFGESFKARHIVKNWLVDVVLYKILFGAVFGVIMGYVGRKLFGKIIRKSESDIEDSDGFEKGLGHGSSWFTQEAVITIYLSFIVFLIGCAATLGIDDLLVSFFAGTAFAWTRWYSGHTEEFKFISSLDYLMNCCYFIYLGSIIPFNEFNNALHVTFANELNIWRLILIGLVVLGIRRLPVVCLLFKFIPDIRNFKESLFVGHFGAIGVGAIYSCMMSIEFLEAEMVNLSEEDVVEKNHYKRLIYMIWPMITYIVFISICVHGGSIAVYSWGKAIYRRCVQ